MRSGIYGRWLAAERQVAKGRVAFFEQPHIAMSLLISIDPLEECIFRHVICRK